MQSLVFTKCTFNENNNKPSRLMREVISSYGKPVGYKVHLWSSIKIVGIFLDIESCTSYFRFSTIVAFFLLVCIILNFLEMILDFKINFFFKHTTFKSTECVLTFYITISEKSYRISGNKYKWHEFNLIHVKTINYAQTCGIYIVYIIYTKIDMLIVCHTF